MAFVRQRALPKSEELAHPQKLVYHLIRGSVLDVLHRRKLSQLHDFQPHLRKKEMSTFIYLACQ